MVFDIMPPVLSDVKQDRRRQNVPIRNVVTMRKKKISAEVALPFQ